MRRVRADKPNRYVDSEVGGECDSKPGALIFNCTVTVCDSWVKMKGK